MLKMIVLYNITMVKQKSNSCCHPFLRCDHHLWKMVDNDYVSFGYTTPGSYRSLTLQRDIWIPLAIAPSSQLVNARAVAHMGEVAHLQWFMKKFMNDPSWNQGHCKHRDTESSWARWFQSPSQNPGDSTSWQYSHRCFEGVTTQCYVPGCLCDQRRKPSFHNYQDWSQIHSW